MPRRVDEKQERARRYWLKVSYERRPEPKSVPSRPKYERAVHRRELKKEIEELLDEVEDNG